MDVDEILRNKDKIQTAFERSGRHPFLTSHEFLGILNRLQEARYRHVVAAMISSSQFQLDQDLCFAFCALPTSTGEASTVIELLELKTGSVPSKSHPRFPTSLEWKRCLTGLLFSRAIFLFHEPLPDLTDVDAFAERVSEFDPMGSKYSLQKSAKVGLACIPEVPFELFCEVAKS
jgi:hypothetical protein